MSRPVSTELPRSVSSSPAHSDLSIDFNDDDDDVSQSPKSAQLSSSIASKGLNKPAKLSFSISRLLGANSVAEKHDHGATSEGESESPSSLCSQCPSMDNNVSINTYPKSQDTKSSSSGHRLTMSPYEMAMNHLSGTGASSVIRVLAHRPPPSMPFAAHPYPWLGPTPNNLIKDGLQSKFIFSICKCKEYIKNISDIFDIFDISDICYNIVKNMENIFYNIMKNMEN